MVTGRGIITETTLHVIDSTPARGVRSTTIQWGLIMMRGLKSRALLAVSASLLSMFLAVPKHANASPISVTFDNVTDLANNFVQTGTISNPQPYVQSQTGGITGGAVTGYSGSEYRATAVYQGAAFNLSAPGSSVQESASLFFDGQLIPLAPGATGIRSFRLGLVDSNSSVFETFGMASLYVEGLYDLQSHQFGLSAVSQTKGPLTNGGLGGWAPVTVGDWYRLDTTITNVGANQIEIGAALYDLGQNGLGNPTLLTSGSWTWQNIPMANLTSAYAAFSDLADGGFPKLDNFEIDGPVAAVPEPSTWAMMLIGLAVIGFIAQVKKHFRSLNSGYSRNVFEGQSRSIGTG
jgi:PEP-CTERM motif-containing protein